MKFSKKTVICILVFLLLFTLAMCYLHITTGSVPDTLVTEVFTFCSFEAGFLGAIKVAGKLRKDNNDKEEPKG